MARRASGGSGFCTVSPCRRHTRSNTLSPVRACPFCHSPSTTRSAGSTPAVAVAPLACRAPGPGRGGGGGGGGGGVGGGGGGGVGGGGEWGGGGVGVVVGVDRGELVVCGAV